MNLYFPPEFEQFVANQVESGKYRSAGEVVRDGLRLLQEREELRRSRLEELRSQIQIGVDQADQGRLTPLTDELVDDIKARGRIRSEARKGQKIFPTGVEWKPRWS